MKPVLLESGTPDLIKRRKRVRLLANKCDTGDKWDLVNDLYSLGLGDPIFCSAQQGDGMQDIFREVNMMIPPSVLEQYKAKRKLRRERYEQLRDSMAEEITAELTKRNRDFDLRSA
jgi:GTPase